jgi:hypothetical protein
MGITASKVGEGRDVYEIDYTDSDENVDGATITATFTNADSGDKSSYHGVNDGSFVVTVAGGYEGEDEVSIVGSDGGQVSGTVTFG